MIVSHYTSLSVSLSLYKTFVFQKSTPPDGEGAFFWIELPVFQTSVFEKRPVARILQIIASYWRMLMNWTSTSKKATFGIATVFTIGFLVNNAAMDSTLIADCSCSTSSESYASHVFTHQVFTSQNCTVQSGETVNWFDWIGGKSPSYQFHFLDLLELLYGDDSNSDHMSQGRGGSV